MNNKPSRRRITAFGSSRMEASDPRFADVVQLGETLGKNDWDVVTGGHQGMMEAICRGIRAGGGHVRGITLERFPTPPDNHLNEEIRARDFFSRMQMLIEETDAYLILPGGLGTLAEMAMSWDLQAIGVLEPRPLIIYGDTWTPLLEPLKKSLIWSVDEAFTMIRHCRTTDEVLSALA
ncbi:MAG: LOG family protein [Mariprofundaceae bacterium]